MLLRLLLAALFAAAFSTARLHAQESAAAELLQRVPDDYSLCFIISDLRGQLQRWNKAAWMQKLNDNPLVRDTLDRKEFRDLAKVEKALKQHLEIDFPLLRDDILGDAVVMAYQPAPKGQGGIERGLALIKARNADTLADVIKKINDLQTQSGELTSLEERKHNGQVYFRRVHQNATHFYYRKGPLFAISSQEDAIKGLLERAPGTASPRRDQWIKAGLTKAVATLWFNPRAFDAELAAQATGKSGPEAALFQSVLAFWKDLDGVLVSVHGESDPELRLSLLARPGTHAAKLWSEAPTPPSDLWQRFPENALITMAGPLDFAATFKKLQEILPEKDSRNVNDLIRNNLGAFTGLDVAREILPNVGPDIGFSLTLPEGAPLPRGIFALAVKPAPKETPVDQMLYKGAQMVMQFLVFDFNRKSETPLRVVTTQQAGVEVKQLAGGGKLIPPGVKPALALKAGYFLVASAPEAIADFRATATPTSASDETPLVKIAPREWSKLMKVHRQTLIDHLVKKNHDSPETAAKVIDGLTSGFELFQSLTLSQRTGNGQAIWIVRLTPLKN